ncbi:LuxR C-terminal-related transcriptional regulator [Vibrio lamellibrachiae]|uniref:LuxR C-terminal-related transcriptional regulator n=1 Tax=Vibrio lamellibrachiae TaxID=2910253 RepID=UPI003D0A6B5D
MKNIKKVYETITLITENSLQSSLLKDALEKLLDTDIDVISINTLSESLFLKGRHVSELVIIDMSVCTKDKIEIYGTCRENYFPNSVEALINCDKSCQYSDLVHWTNLVGVFYNIDDINLLAQGLDKILHGELWLSRKLAQEYILHYRKSASFKTSNSYSKLTKREQQIIKLLGNGDTNVEIADKLFVSENTVKTHLHNVFKKINVKNRLQALIWARENIGFEEFV